MLISLGKISTAFNLTPTEINELWRHSWPTKPVIKLDKLLIDPLDREIHKEFPMVESNDIVIAIKADRYSDRLIYPGLRRRTVEFALDHLLEMYREREIEEDMRQEWNDLAARWRHEKYYGLIIPRLIGHVKNLQKELHVFLKMSYIFFSCVELEEAVRVMHKSAYPLKREVKGLTRDRYQEFVDNLQAPPLEEERTPAPYFEPPPENPPPEPTIIEPAPQSGQRRLPISVLLKAIQAEAEAYGLGKKYYATTDRTIRNWLNGPTAPPPDFSPEVLSSLESIAEFAKKYIEAIVAKGSSELPANAKKTVAFNEHTRRHLPNVETAEDAALVSEAYNDLNKALLAKEKGLQSGKKPETKRKSPG
jgi:hypothetical protein